MLKSMSTTSQTSPGPLRTSHLALRTFSDHIISGCGMDQEYLEKRGRAIVKRAVSATLVPSTISFNQLGLFGFVSLRCKLFVVV